MRVSIVAALALGIAGCIPAEVLSLRESKLGDGFTFLQGGGGNSVILVRGHTALVIDPKMWPWDDDVERLVAAAEVSTVYVVDTHIHGDHSSGNVLFPSATILAAPDVVAGLAQDARSSDDPRPPALPSISIIGHLQLSIAGEPVQLVHVAPAHTSGDVFAWFPASRTLVTGDLFDNTYYPHIDPWNGGTYVGYLQSLEKLSEYPASVVIPGHGPRGTHADVVATRDFLRGIRDAVLTARASGLSGDAIVEKLSPPTGERLSNLGVFSSRAGVVRGFVNELPRQ